jgi:hypothetical protein
MKANHPKPKKEVIKCFPARPQAKALRSRYATDLRDIMLRAQGLPDEVIPYGINEETEVVYPGNGTPAVRAAVLSGFAWSFDECLNHGKAEPVSLYEKYPGLHGESTLEECADLIKQVQNKTTDPATAAAELERRTREARPSLRSYPPSRETAKKSSDRPGRPIDPRGDEYGQLSTELHARMSWKAVAEEMVKRTGKEWNYDSARKASARWKKRTQ